MISLSLNKSADEAREMCINALSEGKALAKFREWVTTQGADPKYALDPDTLPVAAYSCDVLAENDGYISHINTERVGIASLTLGAGRVTKSDEIDHTAGIIIKKKTGDYVTRDEVIATLYTNKKDSFKDALSIYLDAISITPDSPEATPLIYKIVRK